MSINYDITYEYAKMIMINHCPFSYLHTNQTLEKIEKELKNIYEYYQHSKDKSSIDRKIESFYPGKEEEEEDEEEEDEEEEKIKYLYDLLNLLNLVKILIGDDVKDEKELNSFYYNNYFEVIKDNTNLFFNLPDLIFGYIHLKNRGIENFTREIAIRKDYIINGDMDKLVDHTNIEEWIGDEKCINEKGEIISFSNLDLSKMKEGERFEFYFKNFKNDNNLYILFAKQNGEGLKSLQGFHYEKINPYKVIKYACNDEKILREVIHLYNQKIYDGLTNTQKQIILTFIQNEKTTLKNICSQLGNKVYDLISKDIVDSILIPMIYPYLK